MHEQIHTTLTHGFFRHTPGLLFMSLIFFLFATVSVVNAGVGDVAAYATYYAISFVLLACAVAVTGHTTAQLLVLRADTRPGDLEELAHEVGVLRPEETLTH